MPWKGENAGYAQPMALRRQRDLARALWYDAAAMMAAVDFDDDFRLGSGKRARTMSTPGFLRSRRQPVTRPAPPARATWQRARPQPTPGRR